MKNKSGPSKKTSLLRIELRVAIFCFIMLALSGVDQCKDNIILFPSSTSTSTTVSPTATASATANSSATATVSSTPNRSATVSNSSTPNSSATSSASANPSSSVSASASITPTPSNSSAPITDFLAEFVTAQRSAESLDLDSTEDSNLTDSDLDGLGNSDEDSFGTNPQNPDSDGDGFLDGFEVYDGYDPLDSSNYPQYLALLQQRFQGPDYDPAIDADSDGLPDKFEEEIGSNPKLQDTDGDTFFDGAELLNGNSNLNPEDFPTLDTDNDGLSDDFERLNKTNPRLPDTDRDGRPDAFEFLYQTSPRHPDTDSDGLIDGWDSEVRKYHYVPQQWHFD